MKKYILLPLSILFIILFSATLYAKTVTDDPQEQAALEALLKDAELDWDDIKIIKDVVIDGRNKKGRLMVRRKNRTKKWSFKAMSDKKIYLSPDNKIIALNIDTTGLKQISSINHFKSMVFFSCVNCYIEQFDEINGLPELEELQLSNSGIEEIGELKNLPILKFLDLSRNGIKKIKNLYSSGKRAWFKLILALN